MKFSKVLATTLFFSFAVLCSQSFAQSSGIAADKQKQANLEKNKARQAELKKKYNSLTPEQAAAAKKQANEYKKGGYKQPDASGNKSAAPATKPAVKPAAKATVSPSKPAQGKTNTATSTKPKAILMDANGKPLNQAAPATKAKPEASPSKTTAPAKTTTVKPAAPAKKTTPPAKKTKAPAKTTTTDTK